MAKVLQVKYRDAAGSAVQNFGLTRFYFCANANFNNNATEVNRQVTYRSAGTLSNLWANVTANTVNGTSTWRTRVNAVNGAQSLSVGASTTGIFEDATNTDSIAAADEVNYSLVTGGTSGSITTQSLTTVWSATTNTTIHHGGGTLTPSFDSATEFIPLGSGGQTVSAEAETKFDFNSAGTLKNLFAYIPTNGRTTTSTFRSRKNAVDGVMSLSIAGSATGVFEDTVNTDSVAANDDLNYSLTNGTGGGILTTDALFSEFETTNSKFHSIVSSAGGITVNANLTRFWGWGGNVYGAETTESETRAELNIAATVSNLFIYISANSVTAASTFDVRQDAVSTAVTISIGASTTGTFEDAVNSEALVAADLVNFRMATGATGTSLTIRVQGCMLENTETAAVSTPPPFLTLLGVGM